MLSSTKTNPQKIISFISFVLLAYFASADFQQIAQGTGEWWNGYSSTWFFLFFVFVFISLFLLSIFFASLWLPEKFQKIIQPFVNLRERFMLVRWILGTFALLTFPAVMQFTVAGFLFDSYPLRLFVWTLSLILLSFTFAQSESDFVTWSTFVSAALISGATITILAQFMNVNMYPFSQGWSEGNRLWDYSIIFGSSRYDYSADIPIMPYLDIGRQITGGIPFLIPGLNIAAARFWVALMGVLPYMLIGFFVFKSSEQTHTHLRILASLWTFLFIRQGPIHPPLAVSAILVAFAWRKPMLIAFPIIVAASYFAAISRFTWTFAVPIWIVMLEFSYPKELNKAVWIRSTQLGIAGIIGGIAIPKIVGIIFGIEQGIFENTFARATSQSLLWYRLLPNATYPEGVLFGLVIAVLPLITFLLYLYLKQEWLLSHVLQRLSLILPLIVFLVVGLIISTKAGGGGDLHNLDMFIIGLVFISGVAWLNGINNWSLKFIETSIFIRLITLLMVIVPALSPLMRFHPSYYSGNLEWLLRVTDKTDPRVFGFLPLEEDVNTTLENIRKHVDDAKTKGEVLFMDQRQLLTFGYIQVPLVAEYEKKLMMDNALSRNDEYFIGLYKDLEAGRFSLIVSEPLKDPVQSSADNFGEENNLWVAYISRPLLCYYEPILTISKPPVQLLVPRNNQVDCNSEFPAK